MSALNKAVDAMQAITRAEQDRGIRAGLQYAARMLDAEGKVRKAERLRRTTPEVVRATVEV